MSEKKMADEVLGVKCRVANFSNNFGPSEIQNCVKCMELELQLQQVLDELSSVQLTVQMLRKEHIHEDSDVASIQQMETELEVNDTWKETAIRGPKRKIEGKMKLINSKEQIVMANRYAALETKSDTPGNENRMKVVCVNKSRVRNNRQKGNKMYTDQDCLIIEEPQEELNRKTKVQHNLQNSNLTRQQSNLKEGKETCTILSIINGRISKENASETINQMTLLQKSVKLNNSKKTVTVAHRRHKILIIGDSHVRGLSGKVSNSLEEAFSVTGITKPNADTEAITSLLHLHTDNLTKKDLIIFYGGTKDISRNESRKGLRSLKDFAQRTINTNVILLGAPHRYDVPSFSCVNTEVKLFNNKLQSLMSTFNHVRVFNILTERIHHTIHGLHLNKKGKDWIVSNLVKEISKLYLLHRISSPIVLPWKDVNENILQLSQLNKDCEIAIPVVTADNNMECLSLNRNPDCQKTVDSAESVDFDRKGDSANEVPLITANNNMECLNLSGFMECQKLGDSTVSVDFLSKINVGCVGKTPNIDDDSQEVEYVGKPSRLNDNSQEDVIARKSTRLKKIPSIRNQDFLW
jgi:hypothetical protein